MKNKGGKIMLIIILALMIIALVNVVIYEIIHKDNQVKLSFIAFGDHTEKIFEKEYQPEEVDNINVDVSSSNVKIEKVDTDKVKVIAYGDKDEKVKEEINEKELSITKEKTKIFMIAMFYWCHEEIVIQVPNDYEATFKVHTASGDICATNLENHTIDFESTSGKIECGNIHKGTLKSTSGNVRVGNGNEVTLQATSGKLQAGNFDKLSAKTSSGSVEVGTIEEGTIHTTSGKIMMESAKRIQAETSSGGIKINKIEEYCQLQTNSGSIVVNDLNIIDNSSINTKSGNVTIKDKNDIYVETSTKSGNSNIKNNNRKSDIVLYINTTSGNIYVG